MFRYVYILTQTCVCVKAIHPTTDFIGRGFLAEFYNKYHDSFREQLDVFPTYDEAETFVNKGEFDLDKDSEYVEITEIEYDEDGDEM